MYIDLISEEYDINVVEIMSYIRSLILLKLILMLEVFKKNVVILSDLIDFLFEIETKRLCRL